jgi:hypothetical protein
MNGKRAPLFGVFSLFLAVMLAFTSSSSAAAQQKRDQQGPKLRVDLEVDFELQHRADEDEWAFDYPIYGNIGVLYEGAGVEAAVSVDLIEEVSIGETYILGGTGYSYLQIGYYTETWRAGYSWSVIDILNRHDERYPNNVFYRNIMRPNPLITVSFGRDNYAQQVVVSQREQQFQSVDDALIGLHSLVRGTGFVSGLGFIRYAGHRPPLLFLTGKTEGKRTSGWVEVGWWIKKGAPDTVNGVLGGRQNFSSAFIIAELIVEESDLILFLEEETGVGSRISVDLRSYIYLNEFSAAIDTFFSTAVDEHVQMDLGGMYFFGKKGSYFSRYDPEMDNDNKIYFRLLYSF